MIIFVPFFLRSMDALYIALAPTFNADDSLFTQRVYRYRSVYTSFVPYAMVTLFLLLLLPFTATLCFDDADNSICVFSLSFSLFSISLSLSRSLSVCIGEWYYDIFRILFPITFALFRSDFSIKHYAVKHTYWGPQ